MVTKTSIRTTYQDSWKLHITRPLARLVGDVVFSAWKYHINGLENIPRTGPTIAVYNHVSWFDTVGVCYPIRSRVPIPIGKDELWGHFPTVLLLWAWEPISIKRDQLDTTALKKAISVIESKDMLMISPEGTRNRGGLGEPKEGVLLLARKTNAVIVPTGISGSEYFMSNLKKFRRTEVTVNYGKPVRLKPGMKRDDYGKAADEIMYKIAEQIEPRLRGKYSDLDKATMDTIEYVP